MIHQIRKALRLDQWGLGRIVTSVGQTQTIGVASALHWLVAAGADVLVTEAPRNWLAEPVARPVAAPRPVTTGTSADGTATEKPVAATIAAAALAEAAMDLAAINAAIAEFFHPLRRAGTLPQVWTGPRDAPIAILCDQPELAGSDAATLRDRMVAAIGISPADIAIGNLLPWSLTGSRAPRTDEINDFAPFIARAIALARPRLVLAFGQHAAAMSGQDRGIASLRGKWLAVGDTPMLATFHPRQLLYQPELKRLAWADLQAFAARMTSL